MTKKAVIATKEYGGIKFHLKELINERKISRYALARQVDTRFDVINRWCIGDITKLDLDILARICYVLDCKVSDLLEYSPDPAVMEFEDAEAESLPEA